LGWDWVEIGSELVGIGLELRQDRVEIGSELLRKWVGIESELGRDMVINGSGICWNVVEIASEFNQ
jgi:hypothetical protein